MAFKSFQLLFLVLASIAPHVISKHNPILFPQHLHGCRKGDNVEGIHNIKKYLQHYGYLLHDDTSTDSHTNKLNDDTFNDALESAIKSYQKWFNLNISGVLDKETLAQISKPRCGVPDFNSKLNKNLENNLNMSSHYAFFPNNPKWPNTKFHLTYTFTNNYLSNLVPSVTEAMAKWTANSQFTFSEAVDGQMADINISFQKGDHGDGFPFDGPGNILAHAFAPTDGRLHFDGDESWSPGLVENEYNVMTVALHELGHILGLAHSSLPQAIMWPIIDPASSKGLTDDDISGLRALYA